MFDCSPMLCPVVAAVLAEGSDGEGNVWASTQHAVHDCSHCTLVGDGLDCLSLYISDRTVCLGELRPTVHRSRSWLTARHRESLQNSLGVACLGYMEDALGSLPDYLYPQNVLSLTQILHLI